MTSSRNKVSVVIPTYNSWTTLKDCISSIQRQTLKPHEVIIVDNGSSDGTSGKVRTSFNKIKLITLKNNTGVTGGRNKGIENCSPRVDFILFFDHDMVADKNMLKELINVANSNTSTGIVTPKICYFGNKKRIWSAGTKINLWTGKVTFRGGKDRGRYEKIEEVQVAPAAMLVKREVIKKIGGFNEKYFVTYEDTDFCLRAKLNGFKILYAPDAFALHKISPKLEDEADRLLSRSYWVGKNRVLFMADFGKSFFIFVLFLPIFCIYYLLMALKTNRLKDGFNFLYGTLSGLFKVLIPERDIPLSFVYVIRNAIDDKSHSILDLGCGEGKIMEAISVGKRWEITGVDIDSASLKKASLMKVYRKLLQGDVEQIAKRLIKTGKKFDTVMCLEILEHLSKEKGERLLILIEKLAAKKIVITTPRGFMEQIEESLGHNPHQHHVSGWFENEFTKRGYTVRGLGLRPVWSYSGLGRNKLPFVRVAFRLISYFLSPFTYYFPSFGSSLLAIKKVES